MVSYGYIETKLVEGIDGINKNQKQSHTLLSIPPGDDIRVTGPVLYLLSATSKWVVGETIVIDGGTSVKYPVII